MKNIQSHFTVLLLLLVLLIFSCDKQPFGGAEDEDVVIDSAAGKTLILTIDGGGIKGIIPAYILSCIEDSLNMESHQLFDVIGGTSTGGIIALAMSSPKPGTDSVHSANDILGVYRDSCSKIFYKYGSGDFGPKYYGDHDGKGVEPFLQEMFTDTLSLKSAQSNLAASRLKQVFTTTYVLNSNGGTVNDPSEGADYGPYLYNWIDAGDSAKYNYYVWEAARSTSAAPTYFPLAHVGGHKSDGSDNRSSAAEKWAMDGGTMSNDPAVWGIAEALDKNLATSLDDIIVISIGCGLYPYNAGVGVTNEEGGQGFWGDDSWITGDLYNLKKDEVGDGRLPTLLLYGNQFVVNPQMQALEKAGLTYFRIQPILSTSIKMDDCTATGTLYTDAVNYVNSSAGKTQMKDVIQIIRDNISPLE